MRVHGLIRAVAIIAVVSVIPLSAGAQQAPYRLTLFDAIEKALAANVNSRVARERAVQAQGTVLRRRAAALLPRVNGTSYANVQNRNLRAFGLSIPGIPGTVGPFSNYDVRISAQQNIFDLNNFHTYKASEKAAESEQMDGRDVDDDVVRAVASVYLGAESAAARSAAAESRVHDSITLLKLAQDKHDAGTATGVDVLRAQVQLANDRQSLLVARTQYRQMLLALARALGMDAGTALELSEELHFEALSPDSVEALENAAWRSRGDYQALARQREGLLEQQRANRARWFPRLSVSGNYGGIGRSVGGMTGTGMIQAQLDMTIFDRDRDGESLELSSQLRSIDDRIADLHRAVQQEVREALLNLESATEQVEVASQGEALARRELELAQDRFAQGTTNNVEVVTAQDELARAEENSILAVSTHVDAKFALARALGDTKKNIEAFAQAGKKGQTE